MTVETLKKRKEFLRVRGGRRWSTPGFLLEGKRRESYRDGQSGPRFGFTVTKKMGNAVARNRIRRRLRAIVSGLASEFADPTFDYVILARKPALDRPFKQLRADFEQGLLRIHRQTGSSPRRQSEQT
ncbi:MAG: ribonuclease P protein component [Hyphomicrobiaceae bacterium]